MFLSGEDMDFSIRTVREEDAESIVELLNPIIQAGRYTIMDAQLSVDDQIDFIRSFPEQGIYNVAICNNAYRVLGLQDVLPKSNASGAFRHIGEISTFVSLALRRNGIGRALIEATFEEARKRRFLKICATIRADNPQAIAFYRNQGFRIIGIAKKHSFVQGKCVDKVLAERFVD
jgi:L-amino acid N-acyltransferase YncA